MTGILVDDIMDNISNMMQEDISANSGSRNTSMSPEGEI